MPEEPFPRGKAIPVQSPLFWAQQKERYLRQLLIRDIEARTGRRLIVYFANRVESAQIDATDKTYFVEMLEDTKGAPVDLLLETSGGFTDATEQVVSVLEQMAPDLRVIVAGSAKSNGTVICLLGKSIVLGAASELGPIEPQINVGGNFLPATIFAQPTFATQNKIAHEIAKDLIKQTEKLATRLLKNGMKKGAPDAEIDALIKKLSTRDVYFSHGSVIDHVEAKTLGLAIEYLPPDSELWQFLRLLVCMYEADAKSRRYLKIFEGNRLSSAIEVPVTKAP
jgi:ATP-dependent protease ClpP protease subunit